MDSWHPAFLEATGPSAAYPPVNNPPGQPEQPLNSHTFFTPAAGAKEPRKYTAEDWDVQRSEITRLYHDNTLENVRVFMRERHGLDATPKQYKDRIKKWGLDKNIKTAEMEAMIRKQKERAMASNKASAFRVRKRPVNQEKINRYINEHPKRSGSNDDSDVEFNIDSAATPAGISVYTPSNTGPRTPLAAPSPQENSNGYTAASPQHSFSEAQNANLYQCDNLDRQYPDPPSILSNPALFSTPSTPRPHTPHVLMANPASTTPNPQPLSPALSISSTIQPAISTFTGQSPAITPRTLPFLPQVSWQSSEGFQDQARPPLSSLSSSTVWTQTESGVTASARGRYKQSEEEELWGELSIIPILFGESHAESLVKSTETAKVLTDQGRYRSAEEIIRRSISAYKNDSRDDIYKLEALDRLGIILRYQGLFTQAEKIHMRTLQSRKSLLGLEHPSTLASMQNLAVIYGEQGRLKEAEDLELQVTETNVRVLGEEHPSTLTSMQNLAVTYREQGRWKEAEDLGLQVTETRVRVLGQEHPDTLASMQNLAVTYGEQGRYKEAEDLGLQVTETRVRVLGQEHPDTLTSMQNLAVTYGEQGRYKEAEDLWLQVIKTSVRVLGQEHPDTLTSMQNLAVTYGEQGRYKEAEDLELQVIETSVRVLGQEHPDTLMRLQDLAVTYGEQGRWKEAKDLGLQVTETSVRVLGQEHPDTLTSMQNLAATYGEQGRYKEAEDLELQVIETRVRVLGQEHPDTLASMHNLACTWKNYGRYADALKLMEECVQLRTRILGANHPYTLDSNKVFLAWQREIRF